MVFGRLGGALVGFVLQLQQLGDLLDLESAKWISGSADILLIVKREFSVLISASGNFACHHALCAMPQRMRGRTGNVKGAVTKSGELVGLVVGDAVYLDGGSFRRQNTTAAWLPATFSAVGVFYIVYLMAKRRA